MCGIAGVIYRHPDEQKLGADLLNLVEPLESRGPDSCGVGLFGHSVPAQMKIVLQAQENIDWDAVKQSLSQLAEIGAFEPLATGARVILQNKNHYFQLGALKAALATFPGLHLMSVGQQLEIYKETGAAAHLFNKYQLQDFRGSHGIAHTRMATESVVNMDHSHPFSAAPDMCIVHNGQISNYYRLRFSLERQGVVFETNNDSEAIAHYLRYQFLQGKALEEALQNLLSDFDGTYTVLVATPHKIGLVRDKFAAKPAVIYESETMVAIASEYRCFTHLSSFDPHATIREPDAGEINVWSVDSLSPAHSHQINSLVLT